MDGACHICIRVLFTWKVQPDSIPIPAGPIRSGVHCSVREDAGAAACLVFITSNQNLDSISLHGSYLRIKREPNEIFIENFLSFKSALAGQIVCMVQLAAFHFGFNGVHTQRDPVQCHAVSKAVDFP